MGDPLVEEQRVRALQALEIITSGADPLMEQICALASDMFDVPIALVTLLDEQQQWLKARCGLDVERTPRELAFCNHTILSDDVLVVPDARNDERFRSNPFVTGAPHLRFYAGAPLALEPGLRLGALCILDTKPRSFTEQDQHRLAQLASLVVAQIRLHSANVALKAQADLLELRQSALVWSANHDRLTGLANRSFFQNELETTILQTEADDASVGLLMVDLDQFKHANDTLGHDAGDALLRAVAHRLSTVVPKPSLLARLGSDEFGILVRGIKDAADLQTVASQVIMVLREPITYRGHSFTCFASVGQTQFPEDGQSAAELLMNADLALSVAKTQGGNRAVSYRPAVQERFLTRMAALDKARDALGRDAVMPYYQPKIALESGRIVGFEALLRWQNPTLGVQSPITIWDAFSDPVLSVELGRRILDRVLADMALWVGQGVPFGSIAVNVSAAQFSDGDLSTHILDRLAALKLPPRMLELEVTETVFLGSGSGQVGKALKHLSEEGVAIALDDFGTGYASLTHLRQFPIQWLKIDRSFVGDVTDNADAAAIVHMVIGLAQSLDIGIVAEGIETPEQLAFLRERRCDVGQGYLFSKPMPASQVAAFIDDRDVPTRPRPLRLVG